ncbi:hypothetical protein ACLB1O_09125 [Escherichia coli]
MGTTGPRAVWGACSVNYGSRCALRLHVKDNEVTWVETDNTGSDEYGNDQVRACLRDALSAGVLIIPIA